MQQNPLELYQMLYSKGLYKGVSDLYRAWAYYHEVAGDYRNADAVFQLGRKELAQPYEELLEAHKNMIYAAGQQVKYIFQLVECNLQMQLILYHMNNLFCCKIREENV